jgi:hypothetical protein
VAPTAAAAFNTLGLDLVPVACLSLADILFDFDSSFPHPDVAVILGQLAGLRQKHKNAKGQLPPLSVFGHADPVGQDEYNKALSGRRARAVYGLLTHDLKIWNALFNEEWVNKGVLPGLRKQLGAPATQPRDQLFQDFMNKAFPTPVPKSDFLAGGADPKGIGDLQGCSDFNPLVVLSTSENQTLKTEDRDKQNQPDRRVVVFLFRPGPKVNPAKWPCPAATEGTAKCRKQFFAGPPPGDLRRKSGPAHKEFSKTKDTFACRFFDRIARLSPCEAPPPPPVVSTVNPLIAFTGSQPAAAAPARASTSALAAPVTASSVGAPSVGAARSIVVVKKPHTNPDRVRVTLKTDAGFDGTGTFTRSSTRIRFFTDDVFATEIQFNGKDNVFKGPQLTAGVTLLAEGSQASAAMDDVTLTLALSGGSKKNGPPTTQKMTAVDVTLDICKRRTSASADPPKLSQTQKINPGRTIHVQNTANQRQRAMVIVGPVKPKGFTGTLSLSSSSKAVVLFQNETASAGETPLADPFPINSAAIANIPAAGLKFFAQGSSVSGAFRDSQIILGIDKVEPNADHVVVTVVKAQLDLCPARSTAGVVPNPLSDNDKINTGRFVHVQDPGNHQGRAILIVQQVQPADWTGTLLVEASNPRVALFNVEVAATGQAPVANPFSITHGASFPAAGQQLFAQGQRISGALRDTGFKLGIQDVEDDCDHVAITVVRLKNLKADVPSTPANTARLGNSPVGRHTLTRAGGALASADHSEDFTANVPLTLVEDSIQATDLINLSVEVEPATVPVLWSIQRDTRAAPNGDHADTIALSANPVPTLSRNAANQLQATLLANAVGSFHIRPFVDTNGNATFEGDDASNTRVDREPFVIMNLVLIHVQGFTNASVSQQANVRLTPAAPTSASGVQVSTGGFANGPGAGTHNDGTVEVIGGGGDGLRGLDQLFAGWVNNELASAGSPTAPATEDGVATYTDPTPPNATHPRFTAWVNPPVHTGFQIFRPGPPPPPAFTIQAGPVLDTTNFGNEGTGGNRCVGTEGRVGPPVPIVKTARPRPAGGGNLGQRWRIEMWDSPGDNAPRRHEGFAAARLTAYRFNIDFRSDLVFWTNITKTPNPTPNAACRLYSAVYSNGWTIRCSITFNAAGVATITQALTITMTPDGNATKKAVPAANAGVEVRGPVSLNLLIVDATT